MHNVLEIKNYSKSYCDDKRAVDNLNLNVNAGEIHAFIGHKGSGKTSTIRAIVGIMDFNEGEILIDGHSLKKEPVKCKSITAYIPDNPDLYDYVTGIQYLNYMCDMFSVPASERASRIKTYADLFKLTNSLGDLISSYSYGMKQKLALIGALLFTPILPMIIALSIGVLIVAVSVRSKHKNIISLLLSTVGVLLIVYLTTKAQGMDAKQITNVGVSLTNAVNQFYYPPATLFSDSLLNNDWISFIIFITGSLLLGILFVVVVARFYKTLNTFVFSHHASKNYKMVEMNSSTPFMALYKKELNRLISCTIYALNSCIGIILFFVVSIMAVFFMPTTLKSQMETLGIMKIIQNILPLALAIFVSITSTTAPSLSLEGKSRWIMCSVPTKAVTIYNSKIAVNLTVILPVLLVSAILLRTAFPLSLIQTILLFVVPTIYAFYISVMGMFLNIQFPKYDWTSEYYAIKGGAISVLATIGAGMASSLIPLYLCIFFSKYSTMIMLRVTVIVLLVTIIIYKKIRESSLFAI